MTPIEQKFRHCEILIVAESQGDAHLLQALLQASGLGPLRYTLTDRVEEARAWLESDVPDAVLLDLGRADLRGLKRLDALAPVAKRAPVVVVSSTDDPWLRGQVMKRGAVDFVPKRGLDASRLGRSMCLALELSLLGCEREHVCRIDEPEGFGPPVHSVTLSGHDSIGAIVGHVCRSVHDRFRSDVNIVIDMNAATLVPADTERVRQSLEDLLIGLCATSRDLNIGGLDLRLRTADGTHAVLLSIEAVARNPCDDYRSLVLGLLVGQRSDPALDHHLTQASVKLGELGGNLRSRSCDDGHLWLQIDLPKVIARRGVANVG
jgi:CheY-like chemotaxis protein